MQIVYNFFWLKFFSYLDFSFIGKGYYLWNAVALYLIYRLLPKEKDREKKFDPWLLALIFCGYSGVAWCVRTGNVACFELLLITWMSKSYFDRKDASVGIALGLLASLKIIPVLYFIPIFLHLFATKQLPRCLKIIPFLVGSFGIIQLLSYVGSPETYFTYWDSALGKIQGQHSAATELFADSNNPTPILYLSRLFGITNPLHDYFPFWAGVFTVILFFVGYTFRKRFDEKLVFFIILNTVMIALPRLKPYAYTHLLVPLAYLWPSLPSNQKKVLFCTAAVLPWMIFHASYRIPIEGVWTLGQNYQAVFAVVSLALMIYWNKDCKTAS